MLLLKEILDRESIKIVFQPILSVSRKKIIALEALTRGIDPASGKELPPSFLFTLAAQQDLTLELDRLCRKKAFEAFVPIYRDNPDMILSVNFDVSLIDKNYGSGYISRIVSELNLSPENIILEILEAKVQDFSLLEAFTRKHKKQGFIIALDDVGTGHSNLNRFPALKPDLIKIDRYLASNIQDDYLKQEVFKSLVNLSHRIGCLVVAEGVETQQEVLWALENGADLFQGFYFSKPTDFEIINRSFQLNSKIEQAEVDFRTYLHLKRVKQEEQKRRYERIIEALKSYFDRLEDRFFKRASISVLKNHPDFECIYLLNSKGIQISDTIFKKGDRPFQVPKIFSPDRKGADQTSKPYFFDSSMIDYKVTPPYLSWASGEVCVTLSFQYKNNLNQLRLLCIDLKPSLEPAFY